MIDAIMPDDIIIIYFNTNTTHFKECNLDFFSIDGTMGTLVTSIASDSRNYGSLSGYGEQQCCEKVVDPISLLSVIGGIAGITWFLWRAVIDFMVMAGKKRSFDFVFQGM